ncbi:MAG: formate dehydrogenase subunit beta [Lautropia sp.]|nr:formate dehydrogenase subunit beta [Lautropia sp.]
MALQSLDIKRLSATTTTPPQVREPRSGEVAKLIDVSKCIGCKACQTACMEWNDLREDMTETAFGPEVLAGCGGTYDNPRDMTENAWTVMRYTEYENPDSGNLEWLIRKDGCMHCEDPGCLKACPSPGAIVQYTNGIVDFHEEKCIGCGYCVTGCPFDVPRISKKDNKAYKCTLCSDRVAVGMEPACVKTCPTGAIMFGTKKAMKDQAATRIEDLKRRGFDKAGLYDPAGVGGTHVMYVLHHADKPSLYAGLPDAPTINPMVSLWKGIAKPLAIAAMGAAALGSLFHYITKGPNEISKELEDEMEEKDRLAAAEAASRRNARNGADQPGKEV